MSGKGSSKEFRGTTIYGLSTTHATPTDDGTYQAYIKESDVFNAVLLLATANGMSPEATWMSMTNPVEQCIFMQGHRIPDKFRTSLYEKVQENFKSICSDESDATAAFERGRIKYEKSVQIQEQRAASQDLMAADGSGSSSSNSPKKSNKKKKQSKRGAEVFEEKEDEEGVSSDDDETAGLVGVSKRRGKCEFMSMELCLAKALNNTKNDDGVAAAAAGAGDSDESDDSDDDVDDDGEDIDLELFRVRLGAKEEALLMCKNEGIHGKKRARVISANIARWTEKYYASNSKSNVVIKVGEGDGSEGGTSGAAASQEGGAAADSQDAASKRSEEHATPDDSDGEPSGFYVKLEASSGEEDDESSGCAGGWDAEATAPFGSSDEGR